MAKGAHYDNPICARYSAAAELKSEHTQAFRRDAGRTLSHTELYIEKEWHVSGV